MSLPWASWSGASGPLTGQEAHVKLPDGRSLHQGTGPGLAGRTPLCGIPSPSRDTETQTGHSSLRDSSAWTGATSALDVPPSYLPFHLEFLPPSSPQGVLPRSSSSLWCNQQGPVVHEKGPLVIKRKCWSWLVLCVVRCPPPQPRQVDNSVAPSPSA